MFGQDFDPLRLRPDRRQLPTTCTGPAATGPSRAADRGSTATPAAATPTAGAMIYLGDNWPGRVPQHVFMCNIHGNRVNHDCSSGKARATSASTARTSCSPTTRGSAASRLQVRPRRRRVRQRLVRHGRVPQHDGVVDRERPHLQDQLRRAQAADLDLAQLSDAELVELQLHPNDWLVRHARRFCRSGRPRARTCSAVTMHCEKKLDDQPQAPEAAAPCGPCTSPAALSEQLDRALG